MTYTPHMVQHWRAKNDPNGNPQRLFLIMDANGIILDAIDEGYAGMPMWCRELVQLPSVEISRSDYHATLKNCAARKTNA